VTTIVFAGWGPSNPYAPGSDGVGAGISVDSFDYYANKMGRPFGAHRWRGGYGQYDSPILKSLSDSIALADQGSFITTNLTPKYGTGGGRLMTYLQDTLDGHWDTAASINSGPARVQNVPNGTSLTEQGDLLLDLQAANSQAVVVVELWSEVNVQDPPPAAQPEGPDYTGARYQEWFRYVRDFWDAMGVTCVLYCLSLAGPGQYAGSSPDEFYGTGGTNLITSGYVDLVGIDGYSKPTTVGAAAAKTIDEIAGAALTYAQAHGAPVYVPETGCEPGSGNGEVVEGIAYNTKGDWMRQVRAWCKANSSDVWGICYNYDDEGTNHYEPEVQTGTSGGYTTDSWLQFKAMAEDAAFAIGVPILLPSGSGFGTFERTAALGATGTIASAGRDIVKRASAAFTGAASVTVRWAVETRGTPVLRDIGDRGRLRAGLQLRAFNERRSGGVAITDTPTITAVGFAHSSGGGTIGDDGTVHGDGGQVVTRMALSGVGSFRASWHSRPTYPGGQTRGMRP